MLNKIIIMGRLTKDPELRQTNSGTPVTGFSVAVDRNFSKDGEKITDFFDVVAWQNRAEFVARHFTKASTSASRGGYSSATGRTRTATRAIPARS